MTNPAPPEHPRHAKLNSIQVLRAVAAIIVAYNHSIDLEVKYSHSFQESLYHLHKFGSFGVDLFFVISGFVISYSADKYTGIRDSGKFLLHRFKRINPTYYAALLPILLIRLYFWKIQHQPWSVIPRTEFLKSIVLLPIFDPFRTTEPIMPQAWIMSQAWTLSFEWLFYLLFFILIATRVKQKQGLLCAIILLLVFVGMPFWNSDSDIRLRYITDPLLLEFLSGVILYRCYDKLNLRKSYAWALLGIGITICMIEIVNGYGTVNEATETGNAALRVLLWGIPAAIIVGATVFLEKNNVRSFTRPKKWLLLLGNASYSIYLIQELVFTICRHLYAHFGFFMPADLAIGMHLLLVIGLGILFYSKIERSLLRLI